MVQRNHMMAIQTWLLNVLPVYEEKLGDHPFTATTLSWIGNSYHAWVTTTTPLNTAADQFQSEGNCWGNIRKLRSLCMMWVWLTARNRTMKRE